MSEESYKDRLEHLYDGVLHFMYHMQQDQRIYDKVSETVIKLESELTELRLPYMEKEK